MFNAILHALKCQPLLRHVFQPTEQGLIFSLKFSSLWFECTVWSYLEWFISLFSIWLCLCWAESCGCYQMQKWSGGYYM